MSKPLALTPKLAWNPDPTEEELRDPRFLAIWEVSKTWDVNVPEWYQGYMYALGNHAVAILRALNEIN